MSTPKNPDLVKKTMNFREGDFEKMRELFPKVEPSVSIRDLVSTFVDKYYKASPPPPMPTEEIDL